MSVHAANTKAYFIDCLYEADAAYRNEKGLTTPTGFHDIISIKTAKSKKSKDAPKEEPKKHLYTINPKTTNLLTFLVRAICQILKETDVFTPGEILPKPRGRVNYAKLLENLQQVHIGVKDYARQIIPFIEPMIKARVCLPNVTNNIHVDINNRADTIVVIKKDMITVATRILTEIWWVVSNGCVRARVKFHVPITDIEIFRFLDAKTKNESDLDWLMVQFETYHQLITPVPVKKAKKTNKTAEPPKIIEDNGRITQSTDDYLDEVNRVVGETSSDSDEPISESSSDSDESVSFEESS